MKKPFIIVLSAKAADEILKSIENEDEKIVEKIKELLVDGEIRLSNFEKIARRIIEKYERR